MLADFSSNLRLVVDQFTPEILGMFWITEEDLSRELPGFHEFNYIFDGLISQYLYGQEENAGAMDTKANIFFTRNFNKSLFLAHIKQVNDISGILDEQIAVIQGNSEERNKVLIFNTTKRSWIYELQKRYPKFEFIALNF